MLLSWVAFNLTLPAPALSYGRIPWNSRVYCNSIEPSVRSASLDSHENTPQKVNGVLKRESSDVYLTRSVLTNLEEIEIQGVDFLIGPL